MQEVRRMSAWLDAQNFPPGSNIVIVSKNCAWWFMADYAIWMSGHVSVPFFPTARDLSLAALFRHCEPVAAFIGLLENPLPLNEDVFTNLPFVAFPNCAAQHTPAGSVPWSSIIANQSPRTDNPVRSATDIATIIYTSGTTGEPKGVMLTHGNLACNFTLSTKPFRFGDSDLCISYLPLSHVTARHEDYALMYDGATLAYCPKIGDLAPAMAAVRPTIVVAVPRVLEKVRQGIERKSGASPMKKRIFQWALRVGKRHRQAILEGRRPSSPVWKLADKLVFSKIAGAFGGRVHTFFSGGAPLGMDTAAWFADVGIRIFEGFGLTETSPVVALNTPQQHRIGTVGTLLSNVEVRFAEDGELEVKAPSVFQGYWNKPDATAASFTPDGWFLTGDIGKLEDGFLSITDRKKELLKTSGGKFIAPQPIENKLKSHLLVSNAALVGDKHKFASVLISPNLAALEDWAKENGIAAPDHPSLVKDPKVLAEYKRIVGQVNATLAPFENIKRIAVVPDEWSVEGDELTPSMKLKRRVVEKRYAAEIADFYKDEATAKG
jgi:long-chain acyl-CoA synthetase